VPFILFPSTLTLYFTRSVLLWSYYPLLFTVHQLITVRFFIITAVLAATYLPFHWLFTRTFAPTIYATLKSTYGRFIVNYLTEHCYTTFCLLTPTITFTLPSHFGCTPFLYGWEDICLLLCILFYSNLVDIFYPFLYHLYGYLVVLLLRCYSDTNSLPVRALFWYTAVTFSTVHIPIVTLHYAFRGAGILLRVDVHLDRYCMPCMPGFWITRLLFMYIHTCLYVYATFHCHPSLCILLVCGYCVDERHGCLMQPFVHALCILPYTHLRPDLT